MWKRRRSSDKKTGTVQSSEAAKSRVSNLNKVKRNYSEYHFSKKEYLKYIGIYFALDACISYLFFFSWIAFVILMPGIIFFFRERKRVLLEKRKREMKLQFMDGIQIIASSLQAGYSIENALREGLKELRKVYEKDDFILREFQLMEVQLQMNRSMEELFLDFGRRSGIDDIRSFAEVFLTARKSGGDLLAIIRNTVFCIQQKQDTLQEIETCLSGKIMEQNIMSMIPVAILAYVKLTSPDFLEGMYGNVTGVAVMTMCFLVYVLAYFWGQKIIQIEV